MKASAPGEPGEGDADLREKIAAALEAHQNSYEDADEPNDYYGYADAVLAVLPTRAEAAGLRAALRTLCDEAVAKSRYLNGASVVYTRDVRAILAAPLAALAASHEVAP